MDQDFIMGFQRKLSLERIRSWEEADVMIADEVKLFEGYLYSS